MKNALTKAAFVTIPVLLWAVPSFASAASLSEVGTLSAVTGFDSTTDGAYEITNGNASNALELPTVSNPSSWTLEGWVYQQSHADFGPIAQAMDTMWPWLYYDNPSGSLLFANGSYTANGGAQTVGQWHFIAITYDAGSTSFNMYVDGSSVASGGDPATISMSTLRLGNIDGTSPMNGYLDEFRLKDSALTSGEITADMGGPMTCDAGTLWLFHMDGAVGSPEKTANACDGGGGGSSSSAPSGSGSALQAFSGALIVYHSYCEDYTMPTFNESGAVINPSICDVWSHTVEVPYIYFTVRRIRDVVMDAVMLLFFGAFVFLIVLFPGRWYWRVMTHKVEKKPRAVRRRRTSRPRRGKR